MHIQEPRIALRLAATNSLTAVCTGKHSAAYLGIAFDL